MGDQPTDNLHLLVGKLTGTVDVLAQQVSAQTKAIEVQTQSFVHVEASLKQTNDDIRRLRDEVVTPEVLRSIGIYSDEPDEVKKDMHFLRAQRTAHDKREPQFIKLKTAVMITVVTSALAFGAKWISSALADKPIHIETRDGQQ